MKGFILICLSVLLVSGCTTTQTQTSTSFEQPTPSQNAQNVSSKMTSALTQ